MFAFSRTLLWWQMLVMFSYRRLMLFINHQCISPPQAFYPINPLYWNIIVFKWTIMDLQRPPQLMKTLRRAGADGGGHFSRREFARLSDDWTDSTEIPGSQLVGVGTCEINRNRRTFITAILTLPSLPLNPLTLSLFLSGACGRNCAYDDHRLHDARALGIGRKICVTASVSGAF